MGEIRDRQAVPGLLGAMKHADRRVRREAITALGKMNISEAVPQIGRILLDGSIFSTSEDDSVRIAAANALLMIGGTEAMGYLQRGSRSMRIPVRDYCRRLSASGSLTA
jgi:HEAT repeat protein